MDREDVVKRSANEGRTLRQRRCKERFQLGGRVFGLVVLDGDKGRLTVRAGGDEVHQLGKSLGLGAGLAHQLQLATGNRHNRLGSQ